MQGDKCATGRFELLVAENRQKRRLKTKPAGMLLSGGSWTVATIRSAGCSTIRNKSSGNGFAPEFMHSTSDGGAGFNSEGLARLVDPDGLVVAVDLQAHMLAMTRRRLERGGLAERAEFVKFSANDLRLSREPRFGFAVAFSMDHKFRTLRSCSNGCERRSTRAHPCLLSSPKSMSEETRSKPA